MKKYYIILAAAVFMSAALSVSAQNINRPPEASHIKAQLNAPTTTYTVDVFDPDGDELSYTWQGFIGCGEFDENPGGLSAYWSHPNGDGPGYCPHEDGTSHPGTIGVYISDGAHMIFCMYEGSESGTGEQCEAGAAPRNLQYGQNYGWSQWDEWVEFLIIAAVFGWFYYKKPKKKRICGDEMETEAAARAAKEQAERSFDEIDRAKKSAQAAKEAADKAKAEADRARRAAGTRWSASGSTDWEGQHTEISREGWHDKEKGKQADEAAQKAQEAQDKAQKAQDDYNSSGGDDAWSKARDEKNKADDAWRKAKEALDRCLGAAAAASAPAPTPPPAGGPTPTGPTPTPEPQPAGPTGPVTHTPPEQTQTRQVCVNGERRSVETTTETVNLLDLQSVRLMQDRIYSDAGNEAMKFVDWLQTLKDSIMVGKRIKGGVEGYLNSSVGGVAEAADFPDFLTWYDKATDLLTKSMHQLATIMQDYQRLGTYWLEYNTRELHLTCTKYDLCVNGAWQRKCELKIEEGESRTRRTEGIDVHVISELQPTIRRLFNQLKSRQRPDVDRAKRFTETCR